MSASSASSALGMTLEESTDSVPLKKILLAEEHTGDPPGGWDTAYVELACIRKAADGELEATMQGSLNSQVIEGYMYEEGRHKPRDHHQALQCYAQAAREGSVLGAFLLGRICLFGERAARNVERGLRYLQFAAHQGNVDAMETLAWFYLKSRKGRASYNPRKAIQWYNRAAEKGHPRAQYNLGYIYYHGMGARKDRKLAIDWYRKAASNDYRHAQYKLAMILLAEHKGPANLNHAVAWLRMAAEAGYARAQYKLGTMYNKGTGVPQDDTMAVYWHRQAAAQHYARAAYSLALSYETGLGVPSDPTRAFRYLLHAAEIGYPRAQCQLAKIYQSRAKATPAGSETDRNRTLAFEWASKAARNGDYKAQGMLGNFYAKGYGIQQNLERAYGWLYLAGLSGDQKAQQCISRIAALLPEEDIEEAFEWAMHWHRSRSRRRNSNDSGRSLTVMTRNSPS